MCAILTQTWMGGAYCVMMMSFYSEGLLCVSTAHCLREMIEGNGDIIYLHRDSLSDEGLGIDETVVDLWFL